MALYKDLLGHYLEKTGAVTVFDATFYDENDRPVITLDTLTISNLSTESSQKEIRGGQGADLLLTYDYGRTATVEITDALISMYSLKYLWGANLYEGDVQALVKREFRYDTEYVAPANRVAGTVLTILHKFQNGGAQYLEGTTTATMPVAPANAKAGDTYVVYYKAKFEQGTGNDVEHSHVHQLTLTSGDFPKIMKLVGETFLVDVTTGKKVAMQIEFPKFKPNAAFTFTLEAEGDASVFDFGGQALAHNGEVVIMRTLGYMDESAAVPADTNPDELGGNPEPFFEPAP